MGPRRYRAGERIADLCRACHIERDHTVIVVDGEGRVIRTQCDYCGSQHNYRGGGDDRARAQPPEREAGAPRLAPPPLPLVSERERTGPRMTTGDHDDDLETMLRRVLREEMGLTEVVP